MSPHCGTMVGCCKAGWHVAAAIHVRARAAVLAQPAAAWRRAPGTHLITRQDACTVGRPSLEGGNHGEVALGLLSRGEQQPHALQLPVRGHAELGVLAAGRKVVTTGSKWGTAAQAVRRRCPRHQRQAAHACVQGCTAAVENAHSALRQAHGALLRQAPGCHAVRVRVPKPPNQIVELVPCLLWSALRTIFIRCHHVRAQLLLWRTHSTVHMAQASPRGATGCRWHDVDACCCRCLPLTGQSWLLYVGSTNDSCRIAHASSIVVWAEYTVGSSEAGSLRARGTWRGVVAFKAASHCARRAVA